VVQLSLFSWNNIIGNDGTHGQVRRRVLRQWSRASPRKRGLRLCRRKSEGTRGRLKKKKKRPSYRKIHRNAALPINPPHPPQNTRCSQENKRRALINTRAHGISGNSIMSIVSIRCGQEHSFGRHRTRAVEPTRADRRLHHLEFATNRWATKTKAREERAEHNRLHLRNEAACSPKAFLGMFGFKNYQFGKLGW
jgi:hypothetical protein